MCLRLHSGENTLGQSRLAGCYASEFMGQFRFRDIDGTETAPEKWLTKWADRYRSQVYDQAEYEELIAKHQSFTAEDYIRIGRWKDNAKTDGKWKADVASVAYPIWIQASREVPKCPAQTGVEGFLNDWANRRYTDTFKNGRQQTKPFGLSRATALLHFVSGGRFPIFDSRVRTAMKRLLDMQISNTVGWYLEFYCSLFNEVAALCGTKDYRRVDMALFSYGARKLPFSN